MILNERKEEKEVDINYLEECEGPHNVSILLFWYLTYLSVFNVDCLSRLFRRLGCVRFVCQLLRVWLFVRSHNDHIALLRGN